MGEMTSARTGLTPCGAGGSDAFLARMRSTTGIRNAIVLPVPVFAFATMSFPCSAVGMHLACTIDMVSYLNSSSMLRWVRADRPRPRNVSAVLNDWITDSTPPAPDGTCAPDDALV